MSVMEDPGDNVLLFCEEFEPALAELRSLGATATIKFTEHAFLARVHRNVDVGALQLSTPTPSFPVDEETRAAEKTWRLAREVRRAREASPPASHGWGSRPAGTGADADIPARIQSIIRPSDVALYFTDRVLIQFVFVLNDKYPDVSFTEAQIVDLQSRVVDAVAHFLATANTTANLIFSLVWRRVTIDAPPNYGCQDSASCEDVWRGPTLVKLNYGPYPQACLQMAKDLREIHKTDWAYTVFFTNYRRPNAIAYTQWGYAYVVMGYQNSGWPPEINGLIFSHESLHVFGAADEYSQGNYICSCAVSGTCDVPNLNCVACNPNPAPCLMRENRETLCSWSRGQLGWSYWERVDGELDQISVAADGTVWGLGGYSIFRRVGDGPGAHWEQVVGQLKLITVAGGGDGQVWGIDLAGHIMRYLGNAWRYVDGGAMEPEPYSISATQDGALWLTDGGQTVWTLYEGVWSATIGQLLIVSAGSRTTAWGIANPFRGSSVWRYVAAANGWDPLEGQLAGISVAADGTVYGVSEAGNVFVPFGKRSWRMVPTEFEGGISQIAVGSAEHVWGVGANRSIWRRRILKTP